MPPSVLISLCNYYYYIIIIIITIIILLLPHYYSGGEDIGISGSLIWSKTLMGFIFNPYGEFL